MLYLKNLHKKVTENGLVELIRSFTNKNYEVKLLAGKMSGQAFVTFESMFYYLVITPYLINLFNCSC